MTSLSQNNGQQLSIFGWFKLHDYSQTVDQILNITMKPNEGEPFFEKTLANTFIITYENHSSQSYLFVYMADSPNTWLKK